MHEEYFACHSILSSYTQNWSDILSCRGAYGNKLFSDRLHLISNHHDHHQSCNIFYRFFLNYAVCVYRHTSFLTFNHINTNAQSHHQLVECTYAHIHTCVTLFYQLFKPGYENKASLTASNNLVKLPWECVCVLVVSLFWLRDRSAIITLANNSRNPIWIIHLHKLSFSLPLLFLSPSSSI